MIVKVKYAVIKTTEIEVDNKYKDINNSYIPWGQWCQLRRDLAKDVEESPMLPKEAEKVYDIFDKETKELLVRLGRNI